MKRLLFLFVLFLIPSVFASNFGGTDDGFDNGRTLTVTDGLCILNVTTQFKDYTTTDTLENRGSFDDPDDTGTDRTPLTLNISVNRGIGCAGAENTARVRVHETQTCTSTATMDQIPTMGAVNTVTISLRHQLNGWVVGEHCVQINATADDGVTATVSGGDIGKIGVAPYLINPTINVTKENYFKTIGLNHNLVANDSGNITSLSFRLINSSNSVPIGVARSDTTPNDIFAEQLIGFFTNPTPNYNLSYGYSCWSDVGTHCRFSTNSINSTQLNLSNNITAHFGNWDGIGVYNRGENIRKNITVFGYDGLPFTVTGGVLFDIGYRVASTLTNDFTGTSQDVNATGGINLNDLIPTTASVLYSSTGQPYDIYLEVNADVDSLEEMHTTLTNARMNGNLNISNKGNLIIHCERDSILTPSDSNILSIEGYQTVFCWNNIKNVRNENLNAISNMITVNNTTTSRYSVDTRTTASDGWNTVSVQTNSQKPAGSWSFFGNTSFDNNTANDTSYVDFQEGGADPLVITCSDVVQTNKNITCSMKLTYLNGTGITGQTPNLNYTKPDGTSVLITMGEIGLTGNYRATFNASLEGIYNILVNNTFGGTNYYGTYSVFVNNATSGGSGGGLTTEQNSTLYSILNYVQTEKGIYPLTIDCGTIYVANEQGYANITCSATATMLNGSTYNNEDVLSYYVRNSTKSYRDFGTLDTIIGNTYGVVIDGSTPFFGGLLVPDDYYIRITMLIDGRDYYATEVVRIIPTILNNTEVAKLTQINQTTFTTNLTANLIYSYLTGTLTTKIDAIKTVVDNIYTYLTGFITTKLNDIMNIQLNGSTNVTATATVDLSKVYGNLSIIQTVQLNGSVNTTTANNLIISTNSTLHQAIASNFTNTNTKIDNVNQSLWIKINDTNISLTDLIKSVNNSLDARIISVNGSLYLAIQSSNNTDSGYSTRFNALDGNLSFINQTTVSTNTTSNNIYTYLQGFVTTTLNNIYNYLTGFITTELGHIRATQTNGSTNVTSSGSGGNVTVNGTEIANAVWSDTVYYTNNQSKGYMQNETFRWRFHGTNFGR